MTFQPYSEKEAERQLIINLAATNGSEVVKLQGDQDNGATDGVIKFNNYLLNIEARRKGYPNHNGRTCNFKDGWNTKCLLNDGGIFINERTVKNHKNNGFIFLVEIRESKPRIAMINKNRIDILLNQPYREQKSTNSGTMQSIKIVPLNWFIEYF